MDTHVPQAVIQQLRRRGVDVLTARDDGRDALDDASLLARATTLGRLLVTQDIRFHARAIMWLTEGKPFAGVAFAHQLSITIGQFVRDLELIATASEDGECANQIFRLPL
jgi:predicted nuclease of predicted toxin-antitoxin system